MPQIINTNLASINTQRNLDKTQTASQVAMQRLSSGLRINSAKDDAAGLAISTRFISQIQGLNVAVRNAGDGIALAQTAEGALGTMTENLQRIRELAVQSSNATNSDVDREALQAEVSQLIQEITRTASETDFNGRKLLDGTFTGTFQVGANAGQVVDITIAKLTADRLGVGTANGISAIGNANGLQNGDLIINGVAINPSKPSSDTYSIVNPASSAIAKVAAINAQSEATGVTAVVNTNVSLGRPMIAAATDGILTLNGVNIAVTTGGIDVNADRDSVIASINAKSGQTGVVASNGGDGSGVILKAADGRNITVAFGGNLSSSSTGITEGTAYGGYTLVSKNGSDINVQGGQGTGTGDIRNAGLTVGVFSGRAAAVASSTTYSEVLTSETASTYTTGDLTIATGTVINATNNSFTVAVNGNEPQVLRLGTNYNAGSTDLPAAGKYDNAAQLADQINNAISDSTNSAYTSNAAFRDAEGNALFTAAADGDKLVFTTIDKGADTSIVVSRGTGNMTFPTGTVEIAGTAAGDVYSSSINFKFDGNNVFSAPTGGAGTPTLTINNGGAAIPAIAVEQDKKYTATEFADLINNASGVAAAGVTASVAQDGVTVVVSTAPGAASLSLTFADVENSPMQNNYQMLSNGDSVITDLDTFIAALDADSKLGMNVDNTGVQDVLIGSSIETNYDAAYGADAYAADFGAIGNAVDATAKATAAAKYLDRALALSPAGSGVTVTGEGDQVVFSSDNPAGGSVALSQAAADPIGTAALSTATTATSETVAATSGTAQTGNFSVDANGNFVGAGSNVANPLVIKAGENDTFNVAIDGGAAQTVTIAAGSYSNLEALANSITAGYVEAASVIKIAALPSAATTEYNFTANTLALSVSLDGSTAQPIVVNADYSGYATVAEAQAKVVEELQGELDTAFGEGAVIASLSNTGELQLSKASGTTGSLVVTATSATAGATPAIAVAGGSTIPAMTVSVATDKQSLIFTSSTTGVNSSVDITNGTFGIEGGAAAGVITTQYTPRTILQTGDLLINDTAIQGALAKDDTFSDSTALTSIVAGSGIAMAAAINKSTPQTGVTATVNATTLNGGDGDIPTGDTVAVAGSTGKLIINNVETTSFSLTGDKGRDRQAAIESINAIAGQTGVVAVDNGETITLTAADGRNISVAIDNQLAINAAAGRDSNNFGMAIGLSAELNGIGEADISGTEATYANVAETTYSTVTLTAAKAITIAAGENGADRLADLGLQAGTFGGGENGMYLKDIDISTFQGAQAAIMAIDNALGQVSSQRADLGAIQNRMESTVSNLRVTSENLSAANSRIRDADFAAETAALAKAQVLQQAGISILAQANASGQQVLSLLQ